MRAGVGACPGSTLFSVLAVRRAVSVHASGSWPEEKTETTVTLGFDHRHRRRIRLTDDGGIPFLLDLPETTILEHGDGLALDNGNFILVAAAAEEVMDVHSPTPEQGLRIAWHIGNRHVPVQVLEGGGLRIREDHVLANMLENLKAKIILRQGPFKPEPGAYLAHGHVRSGDA